MVKGWLGERAKGKGQGFPGKVATESVGPNPTLQETTLKRKIRERG